jgi:subtilisin family serine protease
MTGRRSTAAALAAATAAAALAAGAGATSREDACGSSPACWPAQQLRLVPNRPAAPVVVAVVDTGVAPPAVLAGRVLRGWSATGGAPRDANGHGTQVAGIVGAVCRSCRILPVQVAGADGAATDADIAAGIRWAADHGARVINVSLAGPCADPVLESAIRDAVARGALVVAAAGNAGSDDPTACADECGGYPAAYAPQVPGLVSVAATGADGRLLPTSNRGSWVELAAPGAAVAPTLDGGLRAVWPGTSYAAAYVSGLAALAAGRDPARTPARLAALLRATARVASGVRVADARTLLARA